MWDGLRIYFDLTFLILGWIRNAECGSFEVGLDGSLQSESFTSQESRVLGRY